MDTNSAGIFQMKGKERKREGNTRGGKTKGKRREGKGAEYHIFKNNAFP